MSGNDRSTRFARPHRYAKSVYVGTNPPSLQAQMGMEKQEQRLRYILDIIRQTCRKQKVDLYKRYNEQDITSLLTIRDEVTQQIPELREYEHGWPVLFYLRLTMHDRGGHTPGYRRKQKKQLRGENCSLSPGRLVHRRQNPPSIVTRPMRVAGYDVSNKRRGTSSTQGTSRHHDAKSGAAIDKDVIIISDSEDLVERDTSGSTSPPSSQLGCSSQATFCNPGTSSLSTSSSHYTTKAPASSVMDMLVSGGIPRTDAQHLAQLLASFGIATGEYLEALARMHSRDVWLLELRGQKKISEIQMRIMRDILDGLAADHKR